jgi:CubicO group peptidase (beta-lactamase class C family)
VVKKIILGVVAVLLLAIAGGIGYLLYLKVPQSASGISAKSACSAVFVAGRDPDTVYDDDIVGASPALRLVSINVDESTRSVTAKTAGLFPRTASLQTGRGCVLDMEPDPNAETFQSTADLATQWPAGDLPAPQSQWPEGVDVDALNAAVEESFVGAGDIAAANARGVAVVQDNQLLVLREAPGFEGGTPLHGWSMTKTVSGMLAYKVFADNSIPLDTPVVEAFPDPQSEPAWVEQWRADDRANITISELFNMTDGLTNVEGYTPFDDTVRMLNSEPDMAAFSAQATTGEVPGTTFNYTSQTSNILAAVTRAQFDSDEEYWAFPQQALFDPIGATSATFETDTDGTWVGSSYVWASTADWARLGELALQDGRWNGEQVLPPGWLEFAATPALNEGEGAGYGGQVWLEANPVGGECRNTPGLPEDVMAMSGHWGQKVAFSESKQAVAVRLGWTFDSGQFDDCAWMGQVFGALPDQQASANPGQEG